MKPYTDGFTAQVLAACGAKEGTQAGSRSVSRKFRNRGFVASCSSVARRAKWPPRPPAIALRSGSHGRSGC